MSNPRAIKVESEVPAGLHLVVYPSADHTRPCRVTKDFAIESFILPLEAARGKVREILNRPTKSGHLEVVESWRQLSDGKIEFTTRLWPTAD